MSFLKSILGMAAVLAAAATLTATGASATHGGQRYGHHQHRVAMPMQHHVYAMPVHRVHAMPVHHHHARAVVHAAVVHAAVVHVAAVMPTAHHHHAKPVVHHHPKPAVHHHGHHHVKWTPVTTKPGQPCKCGTNFYFDRKASICRDARWK